MLEAFSAIHIPLGGIRAVLNVVKNSITMLLNISGRWVDTETHIETLFGGRNVRKYRLYDIKTLSFVSGFSRLRSVARKDGLLKHFEI